MAKFIISNNLSIEDATPEEIERAALRCTFENPDYKQRRRLGKSTYGIPQSIFLFDAGQTWIETERGMFADLFSIFENVEVIDRTVSTPSNLPESAITLKPFQEPAVDALMAANQGMLVAEPGSGKTTMAIELIARLKVRTLWITHSFELMQQAAQRMRQFLPGVELGLVGGGLCALGPVTICLVQSFTKMTEPELDGFGAVLADECHHTPANTWFKAICKLKAKYRYGLSATPERADGFSFLLHAALGRILYTVPSAELYEMGHILQPEVRLIRTGCQGEFDDHAKMLGALTADDARNTLILSHVAAESHRCCIVVSERISHAAALQKQFEGMQVASSALITGSTPKDERTAIIERAQAGRLQVLFCTKLLEEGFDLPRADVVFLTCPIRSKNKVKQTVGRVMRSFPGKTLCTVFDFVDDCGLAVSQFKTRKREVYKHMRILEQ